MFTWHKDNTVVDLIKTRIKQKAIINRPFFKDKIQDKGRVYVYVYETSHIMVKVWEIRLIKTVDRRVIFKNKNKSRLHGL